MCCNVNACKLKLTLIFATRTRAFRVHTLVWHCVCFVISLWRLKCNRWIKTNTCMQMQRNSLTRTELIKTALKHVCRPCKSIEVHHFSWQTTTALGRRGGRVCEGRRRLTRRGNAKRRAAYWNRCDWKAKRKVEKPQKSVHVNNDNKLGWEEKTVERREAYQWCLLLVRCSAVL